MNELRSLDSPTDKLQTLQELIGWFAQTFDCVQGAQTSHTEFIHGKTSGYEYTEYTRACKDINKGKEALINSIYQTFLSCVTNHPEIIGTKLYWRLEEKIELFQSSDADLPSRWIIYIRIAIPELDKLKLFIDGIYSSNTNKVFLINEA